MGRSLLPVNAQIACDYARENLKLRELGILALRIESRVFQGRFTSNDVN